MSIASLMPSNHLILFHPLLLASIFLSLKWPKYWSFSFSISPSNEYSELISFKIEWFDLLALQGTMSYSPSPQFKSIGHGINWLEPDKFKMMDESTSTRPRASVNTLIVTHQKLNDIPSVPGQFWGQSSETKKWMVAQFLEIPCSFPKQLEQCSHSLAYEINQSIKINHGHSSSERAHTLSVECVSL